MKQEGNQIILLPRNYVIFKYVILVLYMDQIDFNNQSKYHWWECDNTFSYLIIGQLILNNNKTVCKTLYTNL